MDVVLNVSHWEAEEQSHDKEFGRRTSNSGSRRASREYRRPTIEEVSPLVWAPPDKVDSDRWEGFLTIRSGGALLVGDVVCSAPLQYCD
jgi:hypothetical protein